ncbi:MULTISPECIES: iron ABC transporter permease [Corynebacterium]|uniref:ABC transporter permease n=1 Tax=Corynebacterium TaxID=1716 RepID=UPI00124EA600|nr:MULTISPECIES: iron ABC transporter permease [Corynebacterium]
MTVKRFVPARGQAPWLLLSLTVVALMLLPLLGILSGLLSPVSDTWRHIQNTLLLGYIKETTIVVIGVLAITCSLASALAWFITATEFPGRRFLSIALVVPLAIPPYIGGYTYVAMTSYTGTIQVFARERLGIDIPPSLMDIQNVPGAIVMFSLFLYPYVYLVVRAFLDRQAGGLIEASRVLGAGPIRTYFQIILPLTRNAVIAGATLVAFEVLSDYGLSQYFGLNVFTTAIFKSWLGFQDVNSALKLAGNLLLVVTIISVGEKVMRGSRSAAYSSGRVTPITRRTLQGPTKWLVMLLSWGTLAFALLIPVAQMAYWAILSLPNIRTEGMLEDAITTVWVAGIGAALTTVFAVIVANNQRLWPSRTSRFLARITVMGYSVPSTVIALAILSVALWIDSHSPLQLMLSPTIVIVAYVIRYLAVSMQSVESGFERTGVRFHESARMLGTGPTRAFFRVDMPMISTALVGAFLLAFIDMVKELAIVLILRPFNFSTLATRVFEYANDEKIPESSLASLMIVLIAALPLLVLLWRQKTTTATSEDDSSASSAQLEGSTHD